MLQKFWRNPAYKASLPLVFAFGIVVSVHAAECIYDCVRNSGCMDGPDLNCQLCLGISDESCSPAGVVAESRVYNPSGAVLFLRVSGTGGNQRASISPAICYKQQACGSDGAAIFHMCNTLVGCGGSFPTPFFCWPCGKVGTITNVLTDNASCSSCGV